MLAEDTLSISSELDTSWANQEYEEDAIDLEPMSVIGCWLLYIDCEGNLHQVYRDKQVLDECGGGEGGGGEGDAVPGTRFSRARLLQFLHTKKTHQGIKYRLMDILLYHNGLDAAQLMSSADGAASAGRLTSVVQQDSIAVAPALCIFHDVNCLYFLFQQPPKYDDDDDYPPAPPRPSLNIVHASAAAPMPLVSALTHARVGTKAKKTKKVTFQDMAYRYTRKRPPSGIGAKTT